MYILPSVVLDSIFSPYHITMQARMRNPSSPIIGIMVSIVSRIFDFASEFVTFETSLEIHFSFIFPEASVILRNWVKLPPNKVNKYYDEH